ncbi:SMC-like protein, putative [Theileria annulata]|uniref:SMC-like protein, putative n=1 Tax=Theileria annulata TaxID=5874 RepID=Q4UG76_THEAN|nr:SMC-like protein, putative [Theileria annulata]CAI73913.1 SMC-like protein, putative [Theileria annulata]|eukprot:XP_954590.1 SMC-like protein, putative [Theileria annulata]
MAVSGEIIIEKFFLEGKSAIVQGIALCFGATGHSVGRDASLNHYIKDYHLKNGPSCAKIEMYISNSGPNSYEPEVYGDVIILSRTIYKNGSTYYLAGSLVKKTPIDRKTLNQYLRKIKLNVLLNQLHTLLIYLLINNPTTYMDQEMCKSFFFQSSSHSFYKYYSSCAGLDKMEEKINTEKKNLEDCKAELRIRKKVLEPDQQKLEQLLKQIESFEQKLNEWKSAKESYKLALYKESVEDYESAKLKYEKQKSNDPTEQITQKEESITQLNTQLAQLKSEINDLITNSMELKDKIRTESDSVSICEDSIKELKTSMVALESNIAQVENDLKKFKTDEKQSETNSRTELDELRKELQLISEEYEKLEEEHQLLLSELTSYEEANNEIESQMKQINSDLEDMKRDYEAVKSNDSNTFLTSRFMLYKYNPVHVRETIQKMKSSSLFVHEPIGPVGEYLRVVQSVPSWKVLPIVERHLKKFLFNWVVHTEQDRVALQKILVENGCDSNNIFITKTNLFTRKTDTLEKAQKEVDEVGFNSVILNFLDVNEIPSVLINIMIDSFNISKTAICKDEKEMIKVLKDEKMKITAAYTINSVDFGKRVNGALFLTPAYDKNPFHYRFVRYSCQEEVDPVYDLKQRMLDLKTRENTLKKYSKELHAELVANKKKVNSTNNKINSINNKKTQLITEKTKLEADLNSQMEIEQLLNNNEAIEEVINLRTKYTEQLASLKKQMSEYEDKLDVVLRDKMNHEENMRTLNTSLESVLGTISNKKMESNKTQTSINSCKSEIKQFLRESINYNTILKDCENSMNEAQKQLKKCENDLKESGIDYSGELPPKKSQEYLRIMNTSREILSSIVDSSSGIENYLESLKAKYFEAEESLKDKMANLLETQKNYSRQKTNYASRLKLFDEYRLRMERLAKAVFKSTLDSVCGYDGNLIFNDLNR